MPASSPNFCLQQRRRRLEPGIRGLRGEGHLLALEVLDLGHAAARTGDDLHLVAIGVVERGHHRERHEARAIHRQRIGTGIEAGDMQPSRAHRLELRGIGLDREELHLLAGDLLECWTKPSQTLRIDGRVLDRRIGEDQHRRIDEKLRILRRIGDQIAVGVGEALVQCLRRQRDERGEQGGRSHPNQEMEGISPPLSERHCLKLYAFS